MSVKHIDQIETTNIPNGTGVTRKMLISLEEAPNFAMRCFTIQAGGRMPNHTNTVEHEQYVIGGRAQVGIGDEVFEVQKGNVVYIPAGVPHWYTTLGEEPFEFICLVPNQPDSTTVLE
ncbi:MAG: cupin domain-containing protein [Chloroflexi bacterium]|nr:cupin domain-containing protein [Anaerolineaceae bacterium]NMB90084.1 cupin domain-containing protein [Chloroflexota bacterium]